MQIGELARRAGTSTDTVRFYEKSGWLPRAARRGNAYRDYGEDEVEHLRLLIELRRLGLPLADAATIAGWCHAGHCAEMTTVLPAVLKEQRAEVASRIAALRELDARLARLERHLTTSRALPMLESTRDACCPAAAAVLDGEAGCACCASVN
jgi:DNA-binding transcriptional MerR regulator